MKAFKYSIPIRSRPSQRLRCFISHHVLRFMVKKIRNKKLFYIIFVVPLREMTQRFLVGCSYTCEEWLTIRCPFRIVKFYFVHLVAIVNWRICWTGSKKKTKKTYNIFKLEYIKVDTVIKKKILVPTYEISDVSPHAFEYCFYSLLACNRFIYFQNSFLTKTFKHRK